MLPFDFFFRTAAKAKTTEYHVALKDLSPQERSHALLPYVVVMDIVIDAAVKEGTKKFKEHSAARAAITSYEAYLKEESKDDHHARARLIMADWRYARFRNCYRKEFCLFEIGMAPTISDQAKAFYKSLRLILLSYGTEKAGIAPKSGMERKVEALLGQLRKAKR